MKILLTVLFAVPSLIFAQATVGGVIIDINKNVLPLCNVASVSRNVGTVTNDKGEFVLSGIGVDDSIKISYIGYFPKIIAVRNLKRNDTILLNQKIKQLDNVVLKTSLALTKEVSIGYINYPDNGEFRFGAGNQIALFIANKKEKEAWIKEVSFKVKAFGKCKNSMRIRVLQMDTVNFMPAIDLLEKNVIIRSNDLKKSNHVDLSTYKIILPKVGVFIVLEWVYPDHNCDKNSYSSISANLLEPENMVWFNFRDKVWSRRNTPRLPNGNYMTPNIWLKVAY
jgi:hypothetical protein